MALHLGGAEPVARHVEHVVDPPGDPVVAVLIAPAAVAGEVGPAILLEVGVLEALVIAPHGARLPGHGVPRHSAPLTPLPSITRPLSGIGIARHAECVLPTVRFSCRVAAKRQYNGMRSARSGGRR